MANILIADDSDSIRLVLKDILSIGKHDVVGEAIDGNESVKMFTHLNPDLLLLDLAMPKKDGLSVVREIISMHPNAKIILVTASDDHKVIGQCLDSGALACLSKPFNFNNALQLINEVLAK